MPSAPVVILVVIVGLLTAYPLLTVIGMSINAGSTADIIPQQVGLGAFRQVSGEWVWLTHSLEVAVPATVFATAMGTLLAWILHRTAIAHKKTLELLIYLPYVTGPLISTFAWIILASPHGGFINVIWHDLTESDASIVNVYTVPWIVILDTIVEAPVVVLIVGAMMQRMDTSLEESSVILGVSKLKTAFKVTLPLMLPAIIAAAVFTFATTLGSYAVPSLIGIPIRFYTLSTAIYLLFNEYPPNYPLAAVLGIITILLAALAVWAGSRVLRSRSAATVSGKGRSPTPIALGRWRYATTGFVYLYIVVTLVMPLAVLLLGSLETNPSVGLTGFHWTVENFDYVLFQYSTTRQAVQNSLLLGILCSTICVLFSFIIAWVVQRTQSSGRTVLRQLTMLPQSIPRLICSVGVLLMLLALPLPIYGSIWAILIAFVIIFLPVAYQSLAGAVGAIDIELEEAGRLSGAGLWRVVRTITAPLLLPALLAGWLLVFMGSVREVSAAIFLNSAYSPVLGPSILSFWASGALNKTSALVVVQIVIIGVAVVIVQLASRRRVEL